MLYQIPNAGAKRLHFGGSAFPLSKFGFDTPKTIYVGFVAVAVNLLVALIVTAILRAGKVPDGGDGTTPDDYLADEDDPRVDADTKQGGDTGSDPRLAPEPVT
jgi:SSS family solute:Na+ symporter